MRNEHILTPQQRSRLELAVAIDQAVGYDALTAKQGDLLREQFSVDGHDSTMSVKSRRAMLNIIASKIEHRKIELLERRFVARQLGYSGLLGSAIGHPSQSIEPMDRPSLLSEPLIARISAQNPHVDRNVILDKSLELDVRWLTEPTVPKHIVR